MIEIESKLAVIGGGSAGVCAALSAARRGIPTVLVQNRPVLGGNSSSEIRVWTRGAVGGGNLYSEEMGVWGELKLTNLYRNPECNPVFWDETLLDLVMQQENLTFLLNTEIARVEVREGTILWVEGDQQGTERSYRIRARVFVDATGDSLLGDRAGVPYFVGDAHRVPGTELGENHDVLCSSILFNSRREDHAVKFVAPSYAYSMEVVESLVGKGGRILSENMGGSDCWWFEYGGSIDTIDRDQDIAIELKRLVLGIWNYIKNSGKYDADNYTLEWIGSVPGKRESRRMETDHILKAQDVCRSQTYPDGAFYGGWYLDMHPSGGVQDTEEENCVQTPIHVYQIPLRCLYSSRIKNLLFAGRNIGTERDAFASSRVMNTCALAGQAAGELGARLVERDCSTAELTEEDIRTIRLRLLQNDMFLPGAELTDPQDLARKGRVLASSRETGLSNRPEYGTMTLEHGAFVCFPAASGRKVRFRVQAREDGVLSGHWAFTKLPNRMVEEPPAGRQSWEVHRGRQSLELVLPQGVDDSFCVLTLEPGTGIRLVTLERGRTGFACAELGSPYFLEPALSYEQDLGFYGPEQVLNPVGRPWGQPNVWQASREDPDPWLELQFCRPEQIREVRLLLDPNLNEELPSSRARAWQESHHLAARTGMPEHLIRDLSLEVQTPDGVWKQVARRENNYLRLVKVELSGEPVRAIRLRVYRTWGSTAAVYGFRAYGSRI